MFLPQNKHTENKKGLKETFESDKYVSYLDCCDGLIGGVCIFQTHQIICIKCRLVIFFVILVIPQ